MDLSLVRVSWDNRAGTSPVPALQRNPWISERTERSAVASDTQLFFKVDTGIYTVTTA